MLGKEGWRTRGVILSFVVRSPEEIRPSHPLLVKAESTDGIENCPDRRLVFHEASITIPNSSR